MLNKGFWELVWRLLMFLTLEILVMRHRDLDNLWWWGRCLSPCLGEGVETLRLRHGKMKNTKKPLECMLMQWQWAKSQDMTMEVWYNGRDVMMRVWKEIYIQVNLASALLIVNSDSWMNIFHQGLLKKEYWQSWLNDYGLEFRDGQLLQMNLKEIPWWSSG